MSFSLTMPKLSPTMETGIIAKWHKSLGDFVEPGEMILEVATDKATVEYNAIDGGYLRKILVQEGEEAAVNDPIALFTESKDESIEETKEAAKSEKAKPIERSDIAVVKAEDSSKQVAHAEIASDASKGRIAASPLAKKLAKDQGVDLSKLKGTGPGGRIVSRDLKVDLKKTSNTPLTSLQKTLFVSCPSKEEPMSNIRKIIAKRLQEAKATIPHFYVTIEIDAGPLVELREQLSRLERKVSFNDLVVKGTALALQEHPTINSGFNEKNQSIIRFGSIDISIAVSIADGLITPIVTLADQKTVETISAEIRTLAKKAKEGKLQPAEFQGGSFTISNLGMFGVSEFQAIINPPQAAILAVSGILDKPVIKGGHIVPGKTMNLTLSVDHRVIDGVAAAAFLKTLQHLLENPASLL